MKKKICIHITTGFLFLFYFNAMSQQTNINLKSVTEKTDTALVCKLTTKELQLRKETVLESLRKQVMEKKELPNGFSYRFDNTDKMLDELTEFIKTEKQCCDFFDFGLSIVSDDNAIWLSLTGPKNAKNFIKAELNL